MTENQEKLDELLTKIKSLSGKVKTTRAQFGNPLVDRVLERVGRISQKLPAGNGHAVNQQPQQPQSMIACPKCNQVQNSPALNYCQSCGHDFRAEERQAKRREEEVERLERSARLGVVS